MAMPSPDVESVLHIVRRWPPAQRFVLMQELLKTLAPPEPDALPKPTTLDQARGLLTTDRPPPSDDDVTRWLDERRNERFGV